jgi:transposase InsO family protein
MVPGSWITNQQVEVYMKSRKSGYTQVVSAAKAGVSERSGREIETGKRIDPRSKCRYRKNSRDPLAEVWESVCVPMLESLPTLTPMTLLEYLQSEYQDDAGVPRYGDCVLRTLQRRVKQWKSLHGPEKSVMFLQEQQPGRMGLSDFTKLKGLNVTIGGQVLEHLLYHFRLSYSGFSHMMVVLGGESFAALSEGLQSALWRLGSVPSEHRTDSLSAAFKNLSKSQQEDMTKQYAQLCEHYGMEASRNNPGVAHENGSVEGPHGHLKRRIKQAFLLRGSYDFESVAAYQDWINDVVNQHNRRNAKALMVEREYLKPLPAHKTAAYTQVCAKVTSSSTIDVKRVTYTVPSRLIGETLQVRLYHDRLQAYVGSTLAVSLQRHYAKNTTTRSRQVDYRHVIHSLVKKPQAFRYSKLRDDLLPTTVYREIWRQLDKNMPPRDACKVMVGLLQLAATQDCEESLGDVVMASLSQGRQIDLTKLGHQFGMVVGANSPSIVVAQHQLSSYGTLVKEVACDQ